MSDEIIAAIIGAVATIIAALIQDSSPKIKRRWLISIGVGLACVALFFAGRGLYELYQEHQSLTQPAESSKSSETLEINKQLDAEEQPFHQPTNETIAAGTFHTVGVHHDGTVAAVGAYSECDVTDWRLQFSG